MSDNPMMTESEAQKIIQGYNGSICKDFYIFRIIGQGEWSIAEEIRGINVAREGWGKQNASS